MAANITSVGRLVPGLIERTTQSPATQQKPGVNGTQENFTDLLSNLLTSVNDLHGEAGAIQQALLNGEPVELHEVMIKLEEAGVATDLLLEIRNKLLNGFNDLMRMPM